jgi:hypothetical protein
MEGQPWKDSQNMAVRAGLGENEDAQEGGGGGFDEDILTVCCFLRSQHCAGTFIVFKKHFLMTILASDSVF